MIRWILIAVSLILTGLPGPRAFAAAAPRDGGADEAPAELVLAAGGLTEYTICIGTDAPAPERFAAEELQTYLARICGAALPIKDVADALAGPLIIIGTQESNPLAQARGGTLAFSAREQEYDAFVVRTRGKDLILAGANPRSCLYAVYDFLEENLGVFWPGVFSQEEIVPVNRNLSIGAIERREAASFKYRGYTDTGGLQKIKLMGKRKMNFTGVSYCNLDNPEFRARILPELRKRGIRIYSSQHGFQYFIPPDKYFADHPEYYALLPGAGTNAMQRQPKQFCTYNSEALKIYTEGCLDFMRRHPEVDIFCPGPDDGYDWCMCDLCGGDRPWRVYPEKQWGSDRLMHAVNAVAERVAQEFPNRPIQYFGYVATGEFPERESPLPNVMAMLAFFERSGSDITAAQRYRQCPDISAYYRENIRKWVSRVPEVLVYEYYCGRASEEARPFVRMTTMVNSLRFMAEQGVKGVITQGLYAWWRPHLVNHYLFAELLWNVNADADARLAHFCRRRYGPAAASMLECFRRMDAGETVKAEAALALAERLTDDARGAELIHFQQIFLKWESLCYAIEEICRKINELCMAGQKAEAAALYSRALELERSAERYIEQTGIGAVIDRPGRFHLPFDNLRKILGEGAVSQEVAEAAQLDFAVKGLMDDAIIVSSVPSLPVANLVRNGGFEQNAAFPAGEGRGLPMREWQAYHTAESDGLAAEAAHTGRYGCQLAGNASLNKGIRQRHLGRGILNEILPADTEMLVGAWSKCAGVNPNGGHYALTVSAGGRSVASLAFPKEDHNWHYAEKTFLLTEAGNEIRELWVLYSDQTGVGCFDDIFLGRGSTELSLSVRLPGLNHVSVNDDMGGEVFASEAQCDAGRAFQKSISVPTHRTYTIRAEDARGICHVRQYPEQGHLIDLAGLHRAGRLAIETTMTTDAWGGPRGVDAVFDGSVAFGSAIYAGADSAGAAELTVKLDRPYRVCRIALCLKPGVPESGDVTVMSGGRWINVKQYEYDVTDAMDAVHVQPSALVTAVRVRITDAAGIKALTDLQVYEDPGVEQELSVGVFTGGRMFGAKGLLQTLAEVAHIQAEPVSDFSDTELAGIRVLLVPCWIRGDGVPHDWRSRLRAFVRSGGGLIRFHHSVGYDGQMSKGLPLFPEISTIRGGGRFDKHGRLAVAKPGHPVACGLPGGVEHAYGDHIAMTAGPAGVPVFTDAGSYPVVIAGSVGAGRVVDIGCPIGLGPGERETAASGSERRLLLNAIAWAGSGGAGAVAARNDILAAERIAAARDRFRETLYRAVDIPFFKIKAMLDFAAFDLDRLEGRVPSAEIAKYAARLKAARKQATDLLDACHEHYEKLAAAARDEKAVNGLPRPAFPADRKDALLAVLTPLCRELAALRAEKAPYNVPDFRNAKDWLANTYLLNMDDKGFKAEPGIDAAARYLGHYGFNVVEQHPEIGPDHIKALDAGLADYGIRQILWPASRRAPFPESVGPMPDQPYVFNPEMLKWRKRMDRHTLDFGRRYAPATFVGLQFDEVLPENAYLALRLQPANISDADRAYTNPFFREYVDGKYGSREREALGLDKEDDIHVPYPDDRRQHPVLWMEYQEFLSDAQTCYWQAVYDYLHANAPDLIMWQLVHRGQFVCQPFTCRWSQLAAIPDVVASSLWMGGSPTLAFFLDLLHANSKGVSVFTSCTAHDGNAETYRRELAISRAHSRGNHIFAWPMVFKFNPRYDLRTGGEPIIADPARLWAITSEHAQIVNAAMPYLAQSESGAAVALVYSERNAMLQDYAVPYTTYGPYCRNQAGLYMALMQAHVPCDPIFLNGLDAEKLARYKVMILSDAGAMTPREIALVTAWVERGGFLIATGGTSLLDQWGREQGNYGLAGVFGVDCTRSRPGKAAAEFGRDFVVRCYADPIDIVETEAGEVRERFRTGEPAVVFNRHVKGASLLITARQPGLSLTSTGMRVRSPFAREITFFDGFKEFLAECVREGMVFAGADLPFTAQNCPDDVEIALRMRSRQAGKVFHLINHSLTRTPVRGVEIAVPIVKGAPLPRVFYPADGTPAAASAADGLLRMRIRDFDVSEMLVMEAP